MSILGLFRRVSEKRPEKEREDKGRSKLKIVILLIAILFLIIGVLYQTGYLRLPGPPDQFSGETEPKDRKTLDRVPDNRPYAIQIKAYRDLEQAKRFVAGLKEK